MLIRRTGTLAPDLTIFLTVELSPDSAESHYLAAIKLGIVMNITGH